MSLSVLLEQPYVLRKYWEKKSGIPAQLVKATWDIQRRMMVRTQSLLVKVVSLKQLQPAAETLYWFGHLSLINGCDIAETIRRKKKFKILALNLNLLQECQSQYLRKTLIFVLMQTAFKRQPLPLSVVKCQKH